MNYPTGFFSLVRLGVGNYSEKLSGPIDWLKIKTLADKHGLSAILVDGVERLNETQRPPKLLLLQWIGVVIQAYEQRYELYRKAMAELAAFYNCHDIKMMVLKGYACALDWPKPEHRPMGDIDIWLFGKRREADELLVKEKGILVDSSHHHHTVFNWQEFVVENHYDFVNVLDYRSSKKLEDIFKELGDEINIDETHVDNEGKIISNVEINGTKVFLPSANLHALFLLRHCVSHFASTRITLRQLLDWAFFIKAHSNEIDWDWFLGIVEKYHMKEFMNCINAICVEELGFDPKFFKNVQFNPSLKDRILSDILNPKFGENEPKFLLLRLIYKYQRWKGNSWKRELCYDESDNVAFWKSIWAHLLKPRSI